jgi:hypothetical protein
LVILGPIDTTGDQLDYNLGEHRSITIRFKQGKAS